MGTAVMPFTPLDMDNESIRQLEALQATCPEAGSRKSARFAASALLVTQRMQELGISVIPEHTPDRWALDAMLGAVLGEMQHKTERPLILPGVGSPEITLSIALELLSRGIHAEAFADGPELGNCAIVIY